MKNSPYVFTLSIPVLDFVHAFDEVRDWLRCSRFRFCPLIPVSHIRASNRGSVCFGKYFCGRNAAVVLRYVCGFGVSMRVQNHREPHSDDRRFPRNGARVLGRLVQPVQRTASPIISTRWFHCTTD